MLKKPNDILAVNLLNTELGFITGNGKKDGLLYGLELELEGRGVGLEGIPSKNWRRVEEGSLRGESTEYVFNQPCEYDEALIRVKRLFGLFEKHGVKLKDTYRTSTHVHLNFSDKTGKEIVNFFFLHTILEEVLEYYCGDMRKGNLFCLSCRDTEDLMNLLNDSLFAYGNWAAFKNDVRYNAANLAALNKFGTIEVRTMRGVNSEKEVVEWLEILKHLYEFACSKHCPTPWKLVEQLSHLGPQGFLNMIFPQRLVNRLMKTWPAAKDLRHSLMDGVRLIQLLAYKLEAPWTKEVKKEEVKQAKAPLVWRNVEGDLFSAANNQIVKPDGHKWHVRGDYPDGAPVGDDANLYYDEDGDRFIWRPTGEPCRWTIYRCEVVGRGTELDRRVNWWLYQQEADEIDDGENLPDWGEQGDEDVD
jgi:hypothetical protein